MSYKDLSKELRENNGWCVWKYKQQENGKPTKVPYNCKTGYGAKANDINTFTDFDTACETLLSNKYNGIGLGIFDTVCAIDIDHCIVDGVRTEMAKDICAIMNNSYIEYSPSEEGLRILFKVDIEKLSYDKNIYKINNRDLGLEVYVPGVSPRYVTVTGNTINPGVYEDRTTELKVVLDKYMKKNAAKPVKKTKEEANSQSSVKLSDKDVISKASSSKNGVKFTSLYNGDTNMYPSPSEADLGLCSMLSFWCSGNATQMDRIFRTSGLYRDKWDRPDGNSTYGANVIEKAISTCSKFYTPKKTSSKKGDVENGTQAQILLEIIDDMNVELFHDELKQPFILIPVGEHKENLPIRSSDFCMWLKKTYYDKTKKPVQQESLKQALGVLEGKAIFDGEMKPLNIRVAKYNDSYWLDLSDSKYRAVKINDMGWQIKTDVPALFYRYAHQQPQVSPKKDGDINILLKYINIKENKTLFLCCLVSYFIPEIPHPIIILYGEKGAAKSTIAELLKMLVDPSVLPTLTISNDMRSMLINFLEHYFIPFDNVSKLSQEISDTLCRVVTGAGIQQRKMFSDTESAIFKFKRCIALNGINNVAIKPDLLDRSILIELERISKSNRKELSKILSEFKKDLPAILGGILDIVVKTMTIEPSVELDELPRMADFSRWGYAIGEALGGKGNEFLVQYSNNMLQQNVDVINTSLVGTLLVEYMKNKSTWQGFVSELFKELRDIASKLSIDTKSKGFPSQPNQFSKEINYIKSNLKEVGISFEKKGTSAGVVISIINSNLSPLPQHSSNDSDITAFKNGDNVEMNLDCGDEEPSDMDLSIKNSTDNGGDGDKFCEQEGEGAIYEQ